MPSELGLHPALQSFINNFTAMKRLRRTEDLDEKRDKQQEIDNKLREAKFKEEMKQHQDEIDHRNEVLKMTQQMQHLQARKTVGDLVRGGSLKPNDNSGNDSQVSVPGQLPKPDLYNVGGYQFNASEVGSPQEQGQAELAYNEPLLNRKFEDTATIHGADAASRMAQALAIARERATQEADRQKFTSGENDKKIKSSENIAGIHESGANSRNASSNASRERAAVLSSETKERLGLKKETDKPKTSVQIKEEEKQKAADAFDTNIATLFHLGNKTKWSQQGFGGETAGKFKDTVPGMSGNEDEINYRSYSGKVFGKQAFSEAGKTLTTNELNIIQKYATDLSKGKDVAPVRIGGLMKERGIVIGKDGTIYKKQADGSGKPIGKVGE